ncbi:ATP-grasp domain-containing protein [Streptomyces sp. VNUA116]|uniref:ATP-grasp domain-containing protein n=1 Tax=Streptomyces sp. VNUA116 TaxID=3062449 RepID=UPI002675F1F8|nr:ATP-grasp domain-containing protein [Streptomyces sp. VNUA116]WKU48835.1 ATP-grasp domain-containing protein [Streptomyces sp. VNUA116]
MRADHPLVVLVDAYGTGRHLRAAFAGLGADVVHLSSTPEPLKSMKAPDLGSYTAALVAGDPAETAHRLAELRPDAVVAGQEPGVPLADVLSEMLGLATNGSALSAARRDKYLMIEAVRKAGVRCARQFKSDDVDAVVAWAREQGDYPVVVKPLAASGAQGVSICADAAEVRRAAAAVLGTVTMYGQTNVEVLAQSYLAGTEYIVDTVSCRGSRYDAGVWRYDKRRRGAHNVSHRDVLVPPDDPVVAELTSYTHDVLDALGIEFGAAHAEVMMTADGPALVEIGARMNGAMHPEFDTGCCGADQARAAALAWLRPDEFAREFAGRTYRQLQEAFVYHVATDLAGVVAGVDTSVLAEIENVGSVRAVTVKKGPGDRIRPTIDLPSSPLTVHMAHSDAAALGRDRARVEALSRAVFRLA